MSDSESGPAGRELAELIVQLLVDAGIVREVSFERAVKIVTKEIEAQAAIGAIVLKK
jgi:hypothetical protein